EAPAEARPAGTKEEAPTLPQHVRFPTGRSRRNSDAAAPRLQSHRECHAMRELPGAMFEVLGPKKGEVTSEGPEGSVASFFSTPFFRGDSRQSLGLEGSSCFHAGIELRSILPRFVALASVLTSGHQTQCTAADAFIRMPGRPFGVAGCSQLPHWVDEPAGTIAAIGGTGEGFSYTGNKLNNPGDYLNKAIFVIKPFSAKKITWDLLICCIVLHDGIVLPLQLLGIEVSTSDMLAWPLTLAWTVDLVVSSIITFERNDGTWETRVRYTFRRYFAGSFLPDFVLAALAWVERFTFSQSFKFLRICRLFRLYRIEAGKIMWLAVFLHFIACLWLSLGRQEGGWVSYHKPGIADIQQYSIAFHWTLAQFHGSMELYPVTVEERIFAFCYLLMAYILAVVFISSMTSAMTRLYLITGIQAGQRNLKAADGADPLELEAQQQVCQTRKASLTAQSHAVPETEVEFLQLVSENLRMELHCEMYGPALRHHPLLAPMTAQMVKQSLVQLCHTAISLALISHGDLVFIQGEVPVEPRMVFITDGDLVYFRSGKFESMSVHPGDHAAEPVLWTDWLHHGTLRVASMRVRLLLLSAKTFQELAQKNTCPEIDLFAYAAEFVRQFNELEPVDRHDLWSNIDLHRLTTVHLRSSAHNTVPCSIMRLGPVPVAYHLVPAQALEVAGWQSLATHPGAEAALCCRFIASFCVAAIACHRDAAKASDAELTVLDPIGDTRAFLENHINAFLQQSDAMALPKKLDQDGSCARRLQQLLMSQAPSRKEAHWNWKVAKLPIADSIAARQGIAGVDLYNGHPTIATYFGAYCMDGLAMALWALWSSNSYSSAVRAGVNLLGDADTVGAIVGQMAGALYGWKQIKSEAFSERCVRNLKYWDKCAEIGLRAALLYHLGPRPRGSLKPADGESKAKLYQRPSGDVPLAGELPAGEWVTCSLDHLAVSMS
ncbi:tri1, partial [Symbiodinium microadriaticum]